MHSLDGKLQQAFSSQAQKWTVKIKGSSSCCTLFQQPSIKQPNKQEVKIFWQSRSLLDLKNKVGVSEQIVENISNCKSGFWAQRHNVTSETSLKCTLTFPLRRHSKWFPPAFSTWVSPETVKVFILSLFFDSQETKISWHFWILKVLLNIWLKKMLLVLF